MNILTREINKVLKEAFLEHGYDSKYAEVTSSNRLDLGQFQCNGALSCAKEYKKNPNLIANEIVSSLKKSPLFKDVNIASPGFINMTITDDLLIKQIDKINKDKLLGVLTSNEKRTIVIDYGGPNVAKPLHVGHLRSAIIGDSIKRIYRLKGHNVIGDIHLGDWGLQMGLVMAQIEEEIPYLKEYDGNGSLVLDFGLNELNEWYPKASKRSKEDESFKEIASSITYKLQNKDQKYYKLWKEIAKLSTNDLKKNYDTLGVEFDAWLGESDSDEYVDTLISTLEKKELLYLSDGALVVDVSKSEDDHEVPPILIKKSNGAILYATTDLATLIQREKDFHPDDVFYVVDNRQSLHFDQVFRCIKKTDLISHNTNLEFVGFGTMNGKDGKPYKTRDGGILKLEDLIEIVISGAKEKIKQLDYPLEEKELIAKKVGLAALKFGDLVNYRGKDYLFDLDRFLSFEGKTGPYLLYTVSRINSILDKARDNNFAFSDFISPYNQEERDLMLQLLSINDYIDSALNEKAPNYIAENVYSICVLFNKFYATTRIMNETNLAQRGSWLTLLLLTKNVIELEINLLGIESINRM